MAPDDTEKLSAYKVRAIESLMTTSSVTQAAQDAGVSRTTLYRWLRTDAAFQAGLEAATGQALQEFSRTLVRLADKAGQALEDALAPSQELKDRLRAADIVTSRLLAIRQMVDMEERLARLEEVVRERTL